MNESTASIARNTKAMMVSQIVTWASSFVLMLFLPRYLGAEDFGRLYFAISVNGIAGLLMDLGFSMLLIKEVARDKTKVNSLLTNGATMRVIAWAISLVLTMAFVVVADYPSQTVYMVFVLGLANVFLGLYDLIHRIFVGLEQLKYRAICLVIEKVFLAVVAVAMLLLGQGSLVIAIVMLLSMALNFFASLYFVRKTVELKLDLTPSIWPSLLRSGLPFMISTVLGFIYFRIDVLMLSWMTNDQVIGWFGAPHRLFDTLMFFPVILNSAVFPVMSRLFHSSRASMDHTSRRVLDVTLIIAIPVAVGMAVLAQPIIALLAGLAEYQNSVLLLQILSVCLLVVYVNFSLNTVLLSHDLQKKTVVVALVATVINVTVNYFAIGYFQQQSGNGAIGAAITKVLTEICVMGMYIYLLPKGSFGFENILVGVKALVSGALMWGAIWFVESQLSLWVISAIVGCSMYTLMLFALKVISMREVHFLIGLLPFRKQVAVSVSNN